MGGALEGIRVVDVSHVLAGPTATMHLADLGAEVIHIEPPHGDDSREFGPFAGDPDKNRSGYFISLNRNKKGMVLDLKAEKGKKILRELIGISDVFVENFRPDTPKKLGFSWDDVQKLNPRIIYCSISGFGHDALPEHAKRPAYDIVVQAFSGLMSLTGPEGGMPCRTGASLGDIMAGTQAALGILAALIHRGRTGCGQHLDLAMVDCLFATLENAVVRHTLNGEIPVPLGSRHANITPFEGYQTRDSWIIVAIGTDALFVRFCKALNIESVSSDPRFRTNPLRVEHRQELSRILEKEFRKKTTHEWADIFAVQDLPYSPINNVGQICAEEHIRHRGMLVEIDQPLVGKMRIVNSPIRLSETPGGIYTPAPVLGQHSQEVLREILGYDQATVDQLLEEGVICCPRSSSA